MDLTSTFRSPFPPEFPLSHRKINRSIILQHKWKWKTQTSASESKSRTITMALKKTKIEGVSEALNEIASQNLDHAPARRRVRSAFVNVQQQLDHILFMWYEINSKGQQIFCKSWLPKPGMRIKGALCFSHGYGIAKYIAAAGYAVYAIDHPGFGLSDGLHGYIPEFDGIVDNVNEQYVGQKLRRLPHFIFGQSMGGAIALKALLKEPGEWDGIILVPPMCKIAEDMTPPVPLQKVLIFLSNIMPQAKIVLTKDLAELAIVASPMLILHGADDKVTDPRVSQYLYENASSSYHCILEGEPDDRILNVLNDIISWLDSRCSSN
ncbi:unnamed protein product [Withania somnifera]